MGVSLHVFVYNFSYQSGKNRMGHDRAGQLMSGHIKTEFFLDPKICGLQIILDSKHYWNQICFEGFFFPTKSFLSHPFTFNCSSFNIATLGLHLKFSAWLKIWHVPVCKMDPLSGYIMQLEPPTTPPHRISLKSVPACKMEPGSGT